MEPRFLNLDGELKSATLYVVSKNLHRRHLTIGERAAIGAEIVDLLKTEAEKRGHANLKNQPHSSSFPIGKSVSELVLAGFLEGRLTSMQFAFQARCYAA